MVGSTRSTNYSNSNATNTTSPSSNSSAASDGNMSQQVANPQNVDGNGPAQPQNVDGNGAPAQQENVEGAVGQAPQNSIIKEKLRLPTLKSLEPTEVKRFLVEYDEKCGKQGVSNPATCAPADLALWIDRAVLDVLAEDRKPGEAATHAVIRAELEGLSAQGESTNTSRQKWSEWMSRQPQEDKVFLRFKGLGVGNVRAAYNEVRVAAQKLNSRKNRKMPDRQTRRGRLERSSWLGSLLPQPQRSTFFKALDATDSPLPGKGTYTLRDEPDGMDRDHDVVLELWVDQVKWLFQELNERGHRIGTKIDPFVSMNGDRGRKRKPEFDGRGKNVKWKRETKSVKGVSTGKTGTDDSGGDASTVKLNQELLTQLAEVKKGLEILQGSRNKPDAGEKDSNGKGRKRRRPRTRACYECHKEGHLARNCPSKKKEGTSKASKKPGKE